MSLPEGQKGPILIGLIWLAVELLRAWNARRAKAQENKEKSMEPVQKVALGIKETDEVVTLIILLAKGGIAAGADGKLDALDLQHLMPALLAAGPAVEGISGVPLELLDLESEEAVKIIGRIAAELTLPSEHAKEILIEGLNTVVAVYALIKVILKK